MSKMEVRKLGDIEDLGIIEMGRGNVISKNDILSTPGNYPVYSSSSSNNGEIGRYGKYMFDDERITWSIDGGGKLFYRNNIKYSVTNVCGWLKVLDEKKIISKYLYYLLINQWQKLNFNYSHKAHPSVIRNEYYVPNIEIKVQEEIVKILDSFTNLIDALNEELALRQKQFEYYREKLLTFDGCVKITVEDFCLLKAGKAINANELSERCDEMHPYACYGGNGIRGYIGKFSHNGTYPIIGRQGALCGCVSWGTGVFYATEHAVVVTAKKGYDSKFLYYLFKNANLNQYKSNGAQPGLAVSNLNLLEFSIPPLAIQQSIVEKLDAFESLISSLKEEIALRQKQYEYYREKLLTFD